MIDHEDLLVSIIVPFYNPDPGYFYSLLNSLEVQTYNNLEIILVDDGSDLNSHQIAENFVSSNQNSRLITQKNKGVAAARQKGIDACNGDLIIHADADDLLPKNSITDMVQELVDSNADIVVAGYTLLYPNKSKYQGIDEREDYWSYIRGLLEGRYHGSLWNKLIKKELYDSIYFEPGLNYMEDKVVLCRILARGPFKISFLNESVYIYRQHNSSITHTLSSEKISMAMHATKLIVELFENKFDKEFLNKISSRARAFEIIQNAKLGVNTYKDSDKILINHPNIPLKSRFIIWLASKKLIYGIPAFDRINKMLNK